MVIDTSKEDKTEPLLLGFNDDMSKINSEYESFMYINNVLKCYLNEGAQKAQIEAITVKQYLNMLEAHINSIKETVPSAVKIHGDSIEKMKLIAFNLTNACGDITNQLNKSDDPKLKAQDFQDICNKMRSDTKSISHCISVAILKTIQKSPNPSKDFETEPLRDRTKYLEKKFIREESQINDVNNAMIAVCALVFITFIGIISYLKIVS